MVVSGARGRGRRWPSSLVLPIAAPCSEVLCCLCRAHWVGTSTASPAHEGRRSTEAAGSRRKQPRLNVECVCDGQPSSDRSMQPPIEASVVWAAGPQGPAFS